MFDIEQFKQRYLNAILDTDKSAAIETIELSLQENQSPETLMFELVVPVMEELAAKVRTGTEATLAQLYLASQISAEASDRLTPLFEKEQEEKGTLVIGTAYEDFHGLGKKIVSGCLKSKFIKVIDLGLSVPAEKFIEAALKEEADVIGISSMMVHTAKGENGPTKVRALLKKKALEGTIALVVGGAPYRFYPELYKEVGADAWAENGLTAAAVITELITQRRAK